MPGCDRHVGSHIRTARLSFLVPVLLLPFSIWILIAAHPQGGALAGPDVSVLIALYSMRFTLYIGLVVALATILAYKLETKQRVLKFIILHNWLALPPVLFMAPLACLFLSGIYSWGDIQPMMVVFWLYGYAVTGFAAMQVFRLPAEWGVTAAVLTMALHQGSLSAVKLISLQIAYLVV